MIEVPEKFKLVVRTFTFNQAGYITDAMHAFTMQDTDFPYLCFIVDDASTDGEQDVIRNYLDENFLHPIEREETDDYLLVLARHTTNVQCFFAVYYLKYNHYSIRKSKTQYLSRWRDHAEYEAICEGDDYWTDSLKLRLMTAFMDSHPQHSMCFHANDESYPDGKSKPVHRYGYDVEDCPITDMISIGGAYAKINAMLIRLALYGRGYREWTSGCPVGDAPMQLTLFEKGKVAYIDRVMSCYRVNAVGSWSERELKDIKKHWIHGRKINRMWRDFDRWTHRKYHSAVLKKRLMNLIVSQKAVLYLMTHKLFAKSAL